MPRNPWENVLTDAGEVQMQMDAREIELAIHWYREKWGRWPEIEGYTLDAPKPLQAFAADWALLVADAVYPEGAE